MNIQSDFRRTYIINSITSEVLVYTSIRVRLRDVYQTTIEKRHRDAWRSNGIGTVKVKMTKKHKVEIQRQMNLW